MMNRREALVAIGATALGAAALPNAALAGVIGPEIPFPDTLVEMPPAAAASSAVDEQLRKDLEVLAGRVNSEEGIPVLLALVDLTPSKKLSKPGAGGRSMNGAIVGEFRETAEAWQRIKPNPPMGDVAHVIEVLAYRDFRDGGKEAQR